MKKRKPAKKLNRGLDCPECGNPTRAPYSRPREPSQFVAVSASNAP